MYRSILVHVAADPGATARIRLAADLARQFEATLIGLAAALPRPPAEAITAGVLDASLVALELEEINADFKTTEQLFRTLAAEAGVKVEWRAVRTFPTLALAAAASAADLLIVGRAGHAAFGNDYRTVDPGDLLIRAGRPIVIAPPEASRLNARNVLVAWKSTREARRAVFDAMSFLKRAEAVNLVEVRESGEASSLQDAAVHLTAHGVRFKAEAVDRNSTDIEDQLIALARRTQSDLIVAGGYGHTRIRELVFGGVTRSLILRLSASLPAQPLTAREEPRIALVAARSDPSDSGATRLRPSARSFPAHRKSGGASCLPIAGGVTGLPDRSSSQFVSSIPATTNRRGAKPSPASGRGRDTTSMLPLVRTW